jgi:hypothetical protein
MANSVAIKPASTGALFTTYKSNPEFGYVVLESSSLVTTGGWIRESKRTCLIRASVATLEKFIATQAKGGTLPGKIQVREYLEDQVPAPLAKEHLREDVSFEEAIEPYLKKAGQDGPALTVNGLRILKFSNWDPTGEQQDIILQHDNIAEVAASKKGASIASDDKAPF